MIEKEVTNHIVEGKNVIRWKYFETMIYITLIRGLRMYTLDTNVI